MKRLGLLWMLVSLLAFEGYAQLEVEEESSFFDRTYTGGGISLSFGNDVTIVGASPILGYMITPRWSAGLGATYLYRKFGDTNSNIYGGKVFTFYSVYNPIFVYGEYELLSYAWDPFDENNRELVPALNLGGGVNQRLGGSASFQLMVVYDVLYDNLRSPSPSALSVRGGIAIGF